MKQNRKALRPNSRDINLGSINQGMKQARSTMAWWIGAMFIGIINILYLSLGGSSVLALESSASYSPPVHLTEITPIHRHANSHGSNTDRNLAALIIEPALTNSAETPIPESKPEPRAALDWFGDVVATAPDVEPGSDSLDNLLAQWKSVIQSVFADR
ncbi:MAG: hypothetical protein AAFY17_08475 [Cyanobacteria bacterium J06642_11]